MLGDGDMQNFVYDIPTIVYFGEGQISQIGKLAAETGKKALIVYGGGSIKKNGLFYTVTHYLDEAGIAYKELGGVEPNPKITSVRKGVEICKKEQIDMLIPIGGGSVIDCAKGIAVGAKYDGDAWDLVVDTSKIKDALTIITVLTIAATGTEMDFYAVISNMETNDKISIDNRCLFPKYSILDPKYTETVSAYQTASGTADIMSHVFEVYFRKCGDTYIQDQFMEGILRTCIKYGKIAVEQPNNYDARANLMWASSWAINGMIACGKSGAWVCHPIEHQLSAYYDITHGMGLAVITPYWMRKILDDTIVDVFVNYGVNVWHINDKLDKYEIANLAIDKTAEFFVSMGIPTTLRELGITEKSKFEIMAEKAAKGLDKAYNPLSKEDVMEILEAAF